MITLLSTGIFFVLGNAEKAYREPGCKPETSLEDLVAEMMEADLQRLVRGEYL